MNWLRWPFAVLWTVYVATPLRMLGMDTGAPPPWRYAMWRMRDKMIGVGTPTVPPA